MYVCDYPLVLCCVGTGLATGQFPVPEMSTKQHSKTQKKRLLGPLVCRAMLEAESLLGDKERHF
jgi:hypothetical protein